MCDSNNKKVFADNLLRYMKLYNLDRNDICNITGVSRQSVSNWLNAKLMPRMNIIDKLASHFDILKSDLIENNNLLIAEKNKRGNLVDAIMKLPDEDIILLDTIVKKPINLPFNRLCGERVQGI